jgi:hypothetical protein
VTARFEFEAAVWLWDGPAAWHFITVPFEIADEIDEISRGRTAGFGSVRVRVTIGGSTWSTSLFPSKQRESFLLPVKKAVRAAQRLDDGSFAHVSIELLDAERHTSEVDVGKPPM